MDLQVKKPDKVEKVLNLFVAASQCNGGCRKKVSGLSKETDLVDQGVEEFQQLKVVRYKYENELEDIYGYRHLSLISPISKFDNFMEVYHNYLINDWIIRNRTHSVISMMEALLDKVIRLYQTIERKEWETNDRIVKHETR